MKEKEKYRYENLVETIEYYINKFEEKGKLSKEQIQDLIKIRNTIVIFGENGFKWAVLANDVLIDNNFIDDFENIYEEEYEKYGLSFHLSSKMNEDTEDKKVYNDIKGIDFAKKLKEKRKQNNQNNNSKNKSNAGKAAVAGAIAGAAYLGKKYLVDPISKSLE